MKTLIASLLFAQSLQAAPALPSFKDLARQVRPSVVNISTEKNIKSPMNWGSFGDPFFDRFFGQGGIPRERTFKQKSLGSGVIIDATSGYVLTNNHVVEGADKIQVKLSDKRELEGEIVGRDPKTDLAVLRIRPALNLSAAPFGDSDAMEVGDWVLAIGSPFGLEQTVSHGIISAKGRVIGQGPYDDFLQTDAPINPGNSGGPLINLDGQVIGINTAITSRSGGNDGVGFAIPSNEAKAIYRDLIKDGKVTRGWLGVSIQELDDNFKNYFGLPGTAGGVLVSDVFEDGPAKKAGLKNGDVIAKFNGQKVESVRELQRLVAEAGVGGSIEVTVWRDKAWKQLKVKVGDMAAFDGEQAQASEKTEKSRAKLGLVVESLSSVEAKAQKLDGGAKVTQVMEGSPAEDAGIHPGDIIVEFDKARISGAEEFVRLAKKVQAGQAYVLRLQREGRSLYLTVKIPQAKD